MNNELMFSTGNNEWGTPQELYNELNKEFGFTLDPCATEKTAKCKKYYTIADNGLQKDWGGNIVFCNPPYGKAEKACKPNCKKKSCMIRGYHLTKDKPGQKDWIEKAYNEAKKVDTKVVLLIPARTDTKSFHKYIYNQHEIRFIKGRVKYTDSNGNAADAAPFPSMIVIMK